MDIARLSLALLLCVSGCRTRGDNFLCLNRGIAYQEPFWRAEIKRGLHWRRGDPEPFLFIGHGGDDADGVWCAWPDEGLSDGPLPLAEVARGLAGSHPGRPVFILSCNKNGRRLGVPGVYYARRVVRCIPYSDTTGTKADQFEELGTDERPGPTSRPSR